MRPRSRSPPSAIPGSWSTPRATGTRGGGPASAWSTCSSSDVTGWARRRPAGCASTLPEPGSPTPRSTPARTSSPGICWCAAPDRGTAWRCCSTTLCRPTSAMLAVLKAGAAYVPLDAGFPADRIAYIVSDAAAAAVLSLSHLRACLAQVRAEVVAVDETTRQIGAQSRTRVTDRRARAGARRAGLHHLHLRLHGAAEGRGGRAREHLQLRPGGRRGVRLPAGRPRLPGPDDRLRLLRRGDLGALGGRRDARAEAPGWQPARRRPARVPHRAPGHRDVLRADAAGHPRGRPARAALPAGVGRGLPARPDRAAGTGPAGGSSTSTARPRRPSPRPGPSSTRTGR